jgi:hypothetical protein
MKGFRIRITKAERETFWYAKCIGNEYWAIKETNVDGIEYIIIPEGRNLSSSGGKWVSEYDCEVIKESRIELVSTTMVVEL